MTKDLVHINRARQAAGMHALPSDEQLNLEIITWNSARAAEERRQREIVAARVARDEQALQRKAKKGVR